MTKRSHLSPQAEQMKLFGRYAAKPFSGLAAAALAMIGVALRHPCKDGDHSTVW
jgi:hypothetical protein